MMYISFLHPFHGSQLPLNTYPHILLFLSIAMNQPKFSVIIPCFNSETYIEYTLHSVLNQNYLNLEIIVVDGGSSEHALQILEKYRSKIHIISEPDNGMYDAINKGIRLSSGDIISYLNSDDLYEPHCLAAVADCYKQHIHSNNQAVFYSNLRIIDATGSPIYTHYYPKASLSSATISNHSLIGQPASFWTRGIHDHLNIMFDTSYKMAADYKFYLDILQLSIPFHKIKQSLASYRVHGNALTSRYRALNQLELSRLKCSLKTRSSYLRLPKTMAELAAYYLINFTRKSLKQ